MSAHKPISELFGKTPEKPPSHSCAVCKVAADIVLFNNCGLCLSCADLYLDSPEYRDTSMGAHEAFAVWRSKR